MPLTYTRGSPYFNTDQKDDLISFLDFIEFREIPRDATDDVITVSTKFHQRPDLLSFDLYGTTELWWVFVVANPDQMIDPIYGLVADLDLVVPTKQRILNIIGL